MNQFLAYRTASYLRGNKLSEMTNVEFFDLNHSQQDRDGFQQWTSIIQVSVMGCMDKHTQTLSKVVIEVSTAVFQVSTKSGSLVLVNLGYLIRYSR